MLHAEPADAPPVDHDLVVNALQEAGYATLLLDLLTGYEVQRDPDAHFNVPQMANRLLAVADWIAHQPPLAPLSLGLVASGTTSGAAVRAAWKAPGRFAAIACLGGRPDLAGAQPLSALAVPLRMVVTGGDPDRHIIEQAYALVEAPKDWQTLPVAADSLVDAHARIAFAREVIDWFAQHLPEPRDAGGDPGAVSTDEVPADAHDARPTPLEDSPARD